MNDDLLGMPEDVFSALLDELEVSVRACRHEAYKFFEAGHLTMGIEGCWIWTYGESGETWMWDPVSREWRLSWAA